MSVHNFGRTNLLKAYCQIIEYIEDQITCESVFKFVFAVAFQICK